LDHPSVATVDESADGDAEPVVVDTASDVFQMSFDDLSPELQVSTFSTFLPSSLTPPENKLDRLFLARHFS
jgi:hypothetical protein